MASAIRGALALLFSFACGGGSEPASEPAPGPEPAGAGAESPIETPPPDGERFLGVALDTQSLPHLSTDFGAGESWSISVGIGPESESAAEVVAGTAETIAALATSVEPIEPLAIGGMTGQQYRAHIQDRDAAGLAFFGAADEPGTGRVLRVAHQTRGPDRDPAVWDALLESFDSAESGEGSLVWLAGLRFRVPTDEGQLTLLDPDAGMTIRLHVTRQPTPAAPLLRTGPERSVEDREDRPHPVAEGAVLTTFDIRDFEGDSFANALLVAPMADGRTLVVHATEPSERWAPFLASLRVP